MTGVVAFFLLRFFLLLPYVLRSRSQDLTVTLKIFYFLSCLNRKNEILHTFPSV